MLRNRKKRIFPALLISALLLTGCHLNSPPSTQPDTRPLFTAESTAEWETLPASAGTEQSSPETLPSVQAPSETVGAESETLPPQPTAVDPTETAAEPATEICTDPAGAEHFDPTRPCYDTGTCRRMDRPFHLMVIYLDDGQSSWDPESMEIYNARVEEGLSFLSDQARQWGVELDFSRSAYCTGENHRIHYEGTVVNDLYTSDVSRDILSQAAADLGCESEEALYQSVSEQNGKDQMAIVIAINRPGVSYTMTDENFDGREEVEYSVIFNGYLNSNVPAAAATTAHELLHQFGAEDYYDPYGTGPRRKKLAEKYYNSDIMLRVYEDLSYNQVGEVTAYTIGWIHEPPEMVRSDDWWN